MFPSKHVIYLFNFIYYFEFIAYWTSEVLIYGKGPKMD
jgi:hypothetical protein